MEQPSLENNTAPHREQKHTPLAGHHPGPTLHTSTPTEPPHKTHRLVLAILSLLLVFALGAGWWFMRQEDTTPSGSTQTVTPVKKQVAPEKPADLTEGGKYFVIEDWGVRFELPKDLQGDLIFDRSEVTSSGSVIFASHRLNSLMGDDSCNLIKQPWGGYSGGLDTSLMRIDPATYPKDKLAEFLPQLDLIATLGGHDYYSTQVGGVTCASGFHPELSATVRNISTQLKGAFVSLEAID